MSNTAATADQFAADGRRIAVSGHPYRLLGSLRLFLATLVLISHTSDYLPGFVSALGLGNVGVMLFFVVSGFVICEALDLFYRHSISKFLINRALKIYPAYLMIVPIAYAARLWSGEPAPTDGFAVLVNVLLLPAYFPQGSGLLVIPFAWAVIIECQFYVVAALTFGVARLYPRLPVLPLVVLASLLLHLWIVWAGSHARFFGGFFFSPFFVLGGILYFATVRRDRRLLLPFAAAFLLSIEAFYSYSLRGVSPGVEGQMLGIFASTAFYAVIAGAMIGLVRCRTSEQGQRIDRRLGDLTYALYLIHQPVVFVVASFGLGGVSSAALIILASFALAGTVHLVAERPIVHLRALLRGQRLHD